jgi:hypothetical protein
VGRQWRRLSETVLARPGLFLFANVGSNMPNKPPWKRKNPRKKAGKAPKTLSPARKAAAKRAAKKAGRRYPNLVDNMREASKPKRGKR